MTSSAPVRGLAAPGRLLSLQRSLHVATTVNELLARASVHACVFCGFTRAVVLTVEDGALIADGTLAIEDPACDALRRRVLASAVRLLPDSEEAELIRREQVPRAAIPHQSVLAAALELGCYVLAPIMPEARVIALLVVDREQPAVEAQERETVELFSHLLGHALERIVLRTRLGELCAELRHMTTSANALMQEVVTAPVTVTTDFGWGPVFSTVWTRESTQALALLTPRELEIVQLMVEGRSNRVIAAELCLAPDTIKAHVARLLRKLGASNRAEAVARYLTMAQASAAD